MSSAVTTAEQISLRNEGESKAIIGFWIYLMTDCVLFAALFATYAVLRNNNFGGPTTQQLYNLPFALAETLILLSSSFICGLSIMAARSHQKKTFYKLMILTGLLGLAFIGLELHEFSHLVSVGDSWRRSGLLSAYFTLVGTHGAHVSIGLIWMATMILRVKQSGLNQTNIKRLTLLSLFWHFLDIVWIFIFSIVYLLGSL